jgi:tRNA dimethylallyltransferase
VAAVLVVTRARDELNQLIDDRCRAMWRGGLLDETQQLLAAPRDLSWRRLEAVGYRQARLFLTGSLAEDAALLAMQRATRAYAKRQLTWFRREPAATWVHVSGWSWVESLADEILRRLAADGAILAPGPLGDGDAARAGRG